MWKKKTITHREAHHLRMSFAHLVANLQDVAVKERDEVSHGCLGQLFLHGGINALHIIRNVHLYAHHRHHHLAMRQ